MFDSKHKKYIGMTTAVLVSAIATGCATHEKEPVVVHDNSLVLNKISTAADDIHRNLSVLSQVEQYNNAEKVDVYAAPTDGPLTKEITMKWNGPATTPVKMIAKMIGYDYRENGHAPVTPPMIAIDANNRKAFEVLNDIGNQTGVRMGILINDKMKLIQVVYTKN